MDNFLEKIKEEQHKQVIQPSANAWERMDAMLVAQANKQKRRKYFLAYAAIFLGVLIGLTTIFSKDKGKGTQQDIVKTQIKTPVDSSSKPNAIEKVLQKSNQTNNTIIASTSNDKVKQPIAQKQIKNNRKKHQIVSRNQMAQLQPMKQLTPVATRAEVTQLEQPKVVIHKVKKPLMQTSDEAINAMLATALHKDTINNTTYQLQVAENTLQQTAATKGDMTVNKFLKHVVQTGVDTVSDIITSNDN